MNSTLDYLDTRGEYISDKPPLRISLLRIVPRRIVVDSGVADRVTRPSLYPRPGLLSLPTASSSDQTRLCRDIKETYRRAHDRWGYRFRSDELAGTKRRYWPLLSSLSRTLLLMRIIWDMFPFRVFTPFQDGLPYIESKQNSLNDYII